MLSTNIYICRRAGRFPCRVVSTCSSVDAVEFHLSSANMEAASRARCALGVDAWGAASSEQLQEVSSGQLQAAAPYGRGLKDQPVQCLACSH